jgi:hypothetical protein
MGFPISEGVWAIIQISKHKSKAFVFPAGEIKFQQIKFQQNRLANRG